MYYSNEDFENFYVRCKAEGLPQKLSIQEYCLRNNVSRNLFSNCKAIGESILHEPNGIAIPDISVGPLLGHD